MHFRLGTAYFALQQWSSAEQEFRNAAELDPKNIEAAFNLALSLGRQGYVSDELLWLKNALARNPSPSQRAEIVSMIQRLEHR
jgi:tetratricopeptide (TPR) repeat protein